jgi:hypothetical protein
MGVDQEGGAPILSARPPTRFEKRRGHLLLSARHGA